MKEFTVQGKRFYDDTPVTITDPCYKKTECCAIRGVEVLSGNYNCGFCMEVSTFELHGKECRHEKMLYIAMYHENYAPENCKKELLGHVGVDSGLCGFYQNKPDYSNKEWDAFCDQMGDALFFFTPEGFCSITGGDGMKTVYALKNDEGKIVGLEIMCGE